MIDRLVIPFYRKARRALSRLVALPGKVTCNICGWQGRKFTDFDCGYSRIYADAECPNCRAHPRHRAFYFFLNTALPTDRQIRLLHFAPESIIEKTFRQYGNIDYLSVDIEPGRAMQLEDITRLSFEDDSFDVIFCSHVLEHVEDDKTAMRELRRVLKPGGLGVLDVPIDWSRDETYEDPSITSPEDRTRAYWQHDHLRLYGRDFPLKLAAAGFSVTVYKLAEHLDEKKRRMHGTGNKTLYLCSK